MASATRTPPPPSPADGRAHILRGPPQQDAAAQPRPSVECVLLWASCALRATENPALEHAIAEANRRGLPLLAVFALTASFPGANERSFAFLLEGLRSHGR